jgi:ATP-dependent 26S proteasome regulatory subunit
MAVRVRVATKETPWTAFADILLQRAALVARVARHRSPDPLAGLKLDEQDLSELLQELPGLEPSRSDVAAQVEKSLSRPLATARAEFASLLKGHSPLALLARTAELTPAESEVLGLLCAVELDPRRERLVGYLNDDVTLRRLTPWTLRQVFAPDEGGLIAVGPGGGLRRAALLVPPGDGPWAAVPVAVASTVMWWLSGAPARDPDLPAGVELLEGTDAKNGKATPRPTGPQTVAVASCPDRLRRLHGVRDALGGRGCLVVTPPEDPLAWDAIVRQATLDGLAVVLEVASDLTPAARDRVDIATHLPWGITSTVDLPLASLPRRPWVVVPVEPARATAAEWSALFGSGEMPPHRLSAEQLRLVGVASRALGGDVAAAMRRLAAGTIDATAMRIRPSRTWEDLVLDEPRTDQVREVARRCRHRETVFGEWGFAPEPSVGVVALFAGPSGTGKTLAAEVIAADLGVDLYKIDLANLVSKYIGETEKNLARVFDAAEAANVALFFDEADALMGKRSAVSDAHDRYANIEVAYLLQRLERYEGLAVLATNLANNIDPAFVRRFHVVVEFPIPGPAERRRIWDRCLPSLAPLGKDVDLDRLAQEVEVPGGTIRNAALGAAFLAADEGHRITMDTLVRAMQREMHKIGRLITSSDLEGLGAASPPR